MEHHSFASKHSIGLFVKSSKPTEKERKKKKREREEEFFVEADHKKSEEHLLFAIRP
jgi:hypothetical protein